jgi:RNA polymerase sigma-70 factor (ECF subfamily)
LTDTVAEAVRIEGGQVLATLIRLTRDIDLAEDALQEASIEAIAAWREGVPDNPGAWLTTVARRKALDRIRREALRTEKETEAVRLLADEGDPPRGDDRLRLVFTCCHPALAPESRIALTLRTIGGLTTEEIAAAFLVPDATMGQRISRAKRKIREAAIPYRIPADHELPERLPAVLAVVYAIFTAGHHAPLGGVPTRVDLADEALRLGRLLAALMPDEPEVHGLVALMAATHARRGARTGGDVVLLEDQDRSLWDGDLVEEAGRHLGRASQAGSMGPYAAQASIAFEHSSSPTWQATDWERIVEFYRALDEATGSPVVRVNRAVAEAMVSGPEAGLACVEGTAGLDRWHLRWATEAKFLAELGRTTEARAAYRLALACPMNDADRRLLEERVAQL